MDEDIYNNDLSKMFDYGNRSCRQGTIRYNRRKIGRNEICPCGSEKKYKRCCGDRFSDNRCHR